MDFISLLTILKRTALKRVNVNIKVGQFERIRDLKTKAVFWRTLLFKAHFTSC